ncbi:MAG: hypothetical protein JNM17_11175 [Archangium sp.]|nr:hypothetical protein [Archangium sp.]
MDEVSRFLPVVEAILRDDRRLASRQDAIDCVRSLRAPTADAIDRALRTAGMLAWLTEVPSSPELEALRAPHAMVREADRQVRLRELNEQATMLPVQAQSSLLAINQRIAAVEALSLEAICRDPDAF